MSELIVAATKIVFLALLWLFILFVADVVRRDMFGRTVPAAQLSNIPAPDRRRGKRSKAPSRLAITQGRQQGLAVQIEPTINLGRAPDSTFHLDDDYASARHAQLVQSDAHTWMLHDLNSTNGTFVNGRRVTTPVPVTIGDVIRIGKTLMRLEV